MKLKKLLILFNILKVSLGGVRMPLFISWSLTNRCPCRCIYCSNWERKGPELDVEHICRIIDDLAKCGTGYISFTGGEPFLKESLTTIVRRAVEHKIIVNINSCGFGVKENAEVLPLIDSLTLSLDGPKQIHNSIRGDARAFDNVIEAVRLGKEAGIKVKLFAVISRNNIDSIDELLDMAKGMNCLVGFQPATSNKLRGDEKNPIALSNEESYLALENIINKKKKGVKVLNSISGLRALQHQISQKPDRCCEGKVSFKIEPDGTFYICTRIKNRDNSIYAQDGIKQGIDKIDIHYACKQCLCTARTELNCILSGKVDSAINQLLLR